MRTGIFLLFIFSITHVEAQTDSSYIKTFEHKLAVKTYLSKNFIFFTQKFKSEEEKTLMPNNPSNIGLGLSLNNTIINVSYGYGFSFLRNKKQGKTKAFDFQMHNYSRKFVFDLFVQKYRGFYEESDDKVITLYPDLKIEQYGAYGQYIFNNREYSYKAAFNQTERQLKSAGSFLLGGGVYKTKIKSDTSFIYNAKNTFNNFQFGISAGYAYTWVLGRYWDISTSATAGINIGSEKIQRFGKQKLEVYPTVFPRLSAGYNRHNWSLSFAYVGNLIFPSMSKDASLSLHSGSFQISFTERFDAYPFIRKKSK